MAKATHQPKESAREAKGLSRHVRMKRELAARTIPLFFSEYPHKRWAVVVPFLAKELRLRKAIETITKTKLEKGAEAEIEMAAPFDIGHRDHILTVLNRKGYEVLSLDTEKFIAAVEKHRDEIKRELKIGDEEIDFSIQDSDRFPPSHLWDANFGFGGWHVTASPAHPDAILHEVTHNLMGLSERDATEAIKAHYNAINKDKPGYKPLSNKDINQKPLFNGNECAAYFVSILAKVRLGMPFQESIQRVKERAEDLQKKGRGDRMVLVAAEIGEAVGEKDLFSIGPEVVSNLAWSLKDLRISRVEDPKERLAMIAETIKEVREKARKRSSG